MSEMELVRTEIGILARICRPDAGVRARDPGWLLRYSQRLTYATFLGYEHHTG
jgi:hypothetical protein